MNDLIPAVESKYSTYAECTGRDGLAASRDRRGFGGFSMGSMNTWHTFEHALDCFRCFAPSSGGPIGDGEAMADIVRTSEYDPEDFFIFAASGTDDFACSGFKSGVLAMGETDSPSPAMSGTAICPSGSGRATATPARRQTSTPITHFGFSGIDRRFWIEHWIGRYGSVPGVRWVATGQAVKTLPSRSGGSRRERL